MKIVSKEPIEKLNFLKASRYNLEKDGKIIEREFIEIGDAVCALVYNTKTNKYVFVKQFRPGTGKENIELVGGLPKGDLTPVRCIHEEVVEETGYKVDSIELINVYHAAPSYSNEKLHMYYVTVSEKIGNGGGISEEDEYIEIVEMTKNEIYNFDFQNKSDAKTILALSFLGLYNIYFLKNINKINLMENPDSRWGGC